MERAPHHARAADPRQHQELQAGRGPAAPRTRAASGPGEGAELLERLRALPDGAKKAEEAKRMIDRVRTFSGYREYPKYGIVSRYFAYKQALLQEAERLVQARVLGDKEDIFYLTFHELHDVVSTRRVDQQLIRRRKDAFRSYQALTPPRVLTSDGEVIAGVYRRDDVPAGALIGLAVSAGNDRRARPRHPGHRTGRHRSRRHPRHHLHRSQLDTPVPRDQGPGDGGRGADDPRRGHRTRVRLAGGRGSRACDEPDPGWAADPRAWNGRIRRDPARRGPERRQRASVTMAFNCPIHWRAMSERLQSSSPITRRDVVKGAVALATLGAGSVLGVATLPQRPPRRPAAPDAAGRDRTTPRGHHRRRCGRRGGGVLSGRRSRRRPVRGEIEDRRSLRFARDRLPRGKGSRSTRRPVLPSRHAPHLRHAARAARPLRSCPPRRRRHAGGARQPVHLPDGRGPAGLFVVAPVRNATAVRSSSSKYIQLARQAVLSDMPWETTVDAWIRSLAVSQAFKDEIVYPWITALIGCPVGPMRCGVGAIDSADVRVVVPGQHRSGRDHVQLHDRPAGQPAAHAGPQPHGAGALQRGRARAQARRAPVGSWRRRPGPAGPTAPSC